MKVIRKGNVYRRASWLKEREADILTVLCSLVGLGVFIMTMLLINYN